RHSSFVIRYCPLTSHFSPFTVPTVLLNWGARHGGARPRRRRVGCWPPARDPSELSVGRLLLRSQVLLSNSDWRIRRAAEKSYYMRMKYRVTLVESEEGFAIWCD